MRTAIILSGLIIANAIRNSHFSGTQGHFVSTVIAIMMGMDILDFIKKHF